MPAVHWLAERVHSPVTGTGGSVDVPGWLRARRAPAPPVRPPTEASPESRYDAARRSRSTYFLARTHVPVPCS